MDAEQMGLGGHWSLGTSDKTVLDSVDFLILIKGEQTKRW